MLNMIILTMLIFLISSLMLFINWLISSKLFKTREKISPFECGFDPMNKNRMPFSIHFFLISLIFLIFDIEITLLIPLIFMFFWFNKIMIFSFFLFMLILILGLYIEYLDQSIDWKI